jgi:hypothetical protein
MVLVISYEPRRNVCLQQRQCTQMAFLRFLLPDLRVVVYPNPAKDQIRILSGSAAGNDLNFIVYNTVGQELLRGSLNAETLINTSNLASGIYFLKLGAQTQRFVINH